MKKFVGVALLGAAIALAPVAASAHYKKGTHKHDAQGEVIGVGAGALAGAVVAGPLGAVVGGIAGLFIVKHAQ